MNKPIGYGQIDPRLKSAQFQTGKMILKLEDGRVMELPISRFPEIRQLTPYQRRKHNLLGGKGLMFDNLDMVYHISDFLGRKVTQGDLSVVAEQKSDYRRPRKKL